jgi:hypothetical protein
VANYAALPPATGSGDIMLVLASSGIWPVRRPAGLWRDNGSWTWLGNLLWTAAELVNVPAGNIAAITVQDAINELDAEKATPAQITTAVSAHAAASNPHPEYAPATAVLTHGQIMHQAVGLVA